MALPVQVNQLAAQTLTKRVSAAIGFTYVGEAAIGSAESAAVWRIRRVLVSDGDAVILWASGGSFDQIWANRTSLTYG
jgi:hypothetical protein